MFERIENIHIPLQFRVIIKPLFNHRARNLDMKLEAIGISVPKCLMRASLCGGEKFTTVWYVKCILMPLKYGKIFRHILKETISFARIGEKNLFPSPFFFVHFFTRPPQALAMSWAPRHIPKTGTLASTARLRNATSFFKNGYRSSSSTFMGPPIDIIASYLVASPGGFSPSYSRTILARTPMESMNRLRVPGPSVST